jgi:outer membrane protein OmpA-like peptidoglycan-associated protein
MRRHVSTLAPCLALLAACAGAGSRARLPVPAGGPSLLKEAELARVRCLLLAPVENATDTPPVAAAATRALEASIDPARTQALPVAELRALLAGTPLELPSGLPGGTALELAELLGADAALYGAVEGRSQGREPGLLVTLRLILAGSRELVFAGSAPVRPAPGEAVDAAVRRTTVELARPALDRLGAPGPHACFAAARREALRAVAAGLQGAPGSPPPARASPLAGSAPLRTERQRDWARRLGARGSFALEEVAFAERSAELVREAGLADLAQVLLATPGLGVLLAGYVDASGDPADDLRLSQAMAVAAARRLAELGVESGRIVAVGRGGENPLVPNFTARGRAANRRLEASALR